MKLSLPNGLIIEGTESQVHTLATQLGYSHLVAREGDGVHYNSSAHGLIKIKDMNTTHLVNAVRKRYRITADNLPTERVDLVKVLRTGVGREDVTLLALINELQTRRD